MAGHTTRLLYEEPFVEMCANLSNWRIDSFMRHLEAEKRKGRVLAFVRGLRFSALLTYAVRDILSGTGLSANWGHLIDETGTLCSRECDVIIHRDGYVQRWNGKNEAPIMDFKFIAQEDAIAVISCKSYLRTNKVDENYCESMESFVDRVWLFAECCGPRSARNIRKKALDTGYGDFWHLYTWSEKAGQQLNKGGWSRFVEEVEKLAAI